MNRNKRREKVENRIALTNRELKVYSGKKIKGFKERYK